MLECRIGPKTGESCRKFVDIMGTPSGEVGLLPGYQVLFQRWKYKTKYYVYTSPPGEKLLNLLASSEEKQTFFKKGLQNRSTLITV